MAKGYLVYVDGLRRPNLVHKTLMAAYMEMDRLAKRNVGREVWILKLQKRVICHNEGDQAISAGSHVPYNGMPNSLVSDLVTGERLREAALDRWPYNVRKVDMLGEPLQKLVKGRK